MRNPSAASIVTEAGLVCPRADRDAAQRQRAAFAEVDMDEDPNSRATYASPPCFMDVLEPSYLGLVPDRDDRPADEAPPIETPATVRKRYER
jgi:hypothetical protein